MIDNMPMRDLLWRLCFRRKIRPHHVTGDTKYGTTENIVAIEHAGIHAYLPLPDMNHRRPFYGQDEFAYDVVRDEYRCPKGQPLLRYRAKHTEEVVYRADAAICNACSRIAQCTGGTHGRTIQRSVYEDYLEKVRGYHATAAYKRAMRKRKVWVEPLLCRGQDVAWLTPAPAPRSAQRQYPRVADRGRPESEALAGRDRVGTANCPVRQPRGPPEGVTEVLNCLFLTISLTEMTAKPIGRTRDHAPAAVTRGLFQHPGGINAALRDVPTSPDIGLGRSPCRDARARRGSPPGGAPDVAATIVRRSRSLGYCRRGRTGWCRTSHNRSNTARRSCRPDPGDNPHWCRRDFRCTGPEG